MGGPPRMKRPARRKGSARRRGRTSAASSPARPQPGTPTVVAIGASAGGLEAIEQFLGGVPDGSGLAFVVVQHLDPTHEGAMPELLQRGTRMPVTQVRDGTRVEADHVYVIAPNTDLSILRGVLHLAQPASPRGLRLPIDLFLRALAEDQRAAAVAVILSGMGTDGTLGLKAVKEVGGLVLGGAWRGGWRSSRSPGPRRTSATCKRIRRSRSCSSTSSSSA